MNDTIAAIATGHQATAIGILRLSGPQAISALDQVFTPARGKPMAEQPNRLLVYGTLHDAQGKALDHCLATVSRGPHSYTGEDTAELQCHGSPVLLTMALEALFSCGVRQAQAGEFTRRAFLAGKMDLTRTEAVADLIHAETQGAVYQAAGQLGGALAQVIEDIYHQLTALMAHFHAVLDYPDEDIDPFEAQEIADTLGQTEKQLDQLTATYHEDLLNGVVEITGDVKYNDNGNLIDAKLQAIPYYAWNNRGNDGVEGQNNCSQMLIWTNTTGASVKIGGASEVAVDDSFTLNAVAAGLDNPTYTWTVKDGDAVEIAEGADTAIVTLNAIKEGTAVVSVTATSGEDSVSAEWTVTVTKGGEPTPGDVDKTLLEKTIAYAEGLDTTGVTDSAVAAFQKALDEAKAVMADENATQAEVNNAWDNLLEGIWGLGLVQGDKTLLEQLITKADGMMANADKYMADHWQELVDALAKAKDVYADGDAMEEDVQPAAQALLNAILAQRFKADKSILEDLIGQAEGMDLTGYTAESVATFRTALVNAQAVMADATLSEDDQKTVDEAVAALTAAMNGLTAQGETQPSDKPETTDQPQTTQKPDAEGGSVQTGDQANVVLPAAVALLALAGLMFVVSFGTKKRG